MSAAPGEQGSRAGEVAELLAAYAQANRPAPGEAMLVILDAPLRVVWADAAANQLFGTTDLDSISDLVFAVPGPGGLRARLSCLLDGAPPRFERLRLVQGFRSRLLTVSVCRVVQPSGQPLFVLTTPTGRGTGSEPLANGASPDPQAEGRHSPEAAVGADAPTATHADADQPDGALNHRFLWRTDAEDRLTLIAQGWPGLRGLADDALIGRPFAKGVGFDREAAAALAAALATRASWSDVLLHWAREDAAGSLPVVLGAVPVRRADASFGGFRGFGVIAPRRRAVGETTPPEPAVSAPEQAEASPIMQAPIIDATIAEPQVVAPRIADPPVADPETIVTDAPASVFTDAPASEATATPDVPDDHPVAAAEGRGTDPDRVLAVAPEEELKPEVFSSKVVELRRYQPAVAYSPMGRGQGREAEGSAAEEPRGDGRFGSTNLSSMERSAFQEIARALGARMPDEPRGDGRLVADGLPEPSVAPNELAASAFAERRLEPPGEVAIIGDLPVAVLVVEQTRVVYANRSFAALTGYASADALAEAGGIEHLLGGHTPAEIFASANERTVSLVGEDGASLECQGRLVATTWAGAAASLLTLRRADMPACDPGAETRSPDVSPDDSRAALDQIGEAVAILDANGRILVLNQAGERLFGCNAAGVTGDPFTLLLDPASHADAVDLLIAMQIGDQDGSRTIDVLPRAPHGRRQAVQMIVRPLSPNRICALWRDRPAARAVEPEPADLRADVDEAKAVRSDFLAKVSHEIRTPLNAILGFAEVILDERFGPIDNERYRDYLRDIHESGTRVMALVTDLLDLSKMEAGEVEMSVAAVDANRVVSECVGRMQASAHRERVIMRMSLMPRLPSALVDEPALRQVLMSILSNAVKFNEPGGQVIVSTAVNEAGAVAVRVRDTGVGMTDTEIASAIEPFRQINTGRPRGGNGLGLPLARALVEANQATLSIKSRKNEGTLVEILLRAMQAEPIRVPA